MKKRKRMKGKVQKVITSVPPTEPEKVQINIEEAEDLYREIRVENEVTDEAGNKAKLKAGVEVDVVIEADSSAVIKKVE